MENNEKLNAENTAQIEDAHLENTAGGRGDITYLTCAHCGNPVTYGIHDAFIRANICPYCSKKIVLWK